MAEQTGYTAAQYLDAITLALRAGDMHAVVALLHGLAVVSPADAEAVMLAVQLAADRG